jgi:integrase
VRADDPEKTQKTPSSLRLVPVHSELRKLGFIEYAAARREAGGPRSRLFPDLPTATKGYASNNFSRWFGRFLDSLGIDDPKKTFHSFRHTFRDAMIVGGVAPEIRDRMGGWAPTTTGQKYGGSAEVKAKTYAPEIAKVSYSTLSLDHLYSSASAAYRPRPNAARRMTSGS